MTQIHQYYNDQLAKNRWQFYIESPVASGILPEGVASDPAHTDIAADKLTLLRWRIWFLGWAVYASATCNNLPAENSSGRPQFVLHAHGRFVGTAEGWLRRTVRPMANSHFWKLICSAFMSTVS